MEKKKKITMGEIAEHFGVTATTISRAINGAPDISPETQREILEYCEQVGYVSRRSKAFKRQYAVFWCSNSRENEFLNALAASFRKAASEARCSVVDILVDNDFDLDKVFSEKRLDGGLVLGLTFNSSTYLQIKQSTHPLVLFNSQVENNDFVACVKSQDFLAAIGAIDYLVSLGHTQIGFIGDDKDPIANSERLIGYATGLQNNAIPYRYDLTFIGSGTETSGAEAAEYFLMRNKAVTAVLSTTAEAATGFISTMNRAGYAVPRDCSVITFYDKIAQEYEISALVRDHELAGKKAFAALKIFMENRCSVESGVSCNFLCKEKTCAPKKTPFRTDV